MPEARESEPAVTGVFRDWPSQAVRERITAHVGGPGSRRRRRVLVVVLLAVVLLAGGLAAGLTLRHLDHQYGPIQQGPFSGPYSSRGFVVGRDGYTLSLASTPNATGRLLASVMNLGAHSVKITSVDPEDVATVTGWSVYRTVDGGFVSGISTPWHTFPAIVPAHGIVRLLIAIHHPSNCTAFPKIRGVSSASYDGSLRVHWESLLHGHATWISVLGPDDDIRVC